MQLDFCVFVLMYRDQNDKFCGNFKKFKIVSNNFLGNPDIDF